jgi:hypothetical protein
MRLTIHAVHARGFPVEIELDHDEQEKVDTIMDRLCRSGYRPPEAVWPTGPDGAPLCMKHGGVIMSKRSKQGDEWWSHRVVTPGGEELYCRGVPSGRADDGYHC